MNLFANLLLSLFLGIFVGAFTKWSTGAFATFIILAIFLTNLKKIKFWTKIIIGNLLAIELLLQITAFFGLLPGINIFSFTPYARLYRTEEGFSNSQANRFGWNSKEIEIKDDHYKIALIGDSFVHALQVHRKNNIGAV